MPSRPPCGRAAAVPPDDLTLSYADEVKLLRSPRRTPWRWVLVVGGLVLFLWLPTYLGDPGLRVLSLLRHLCHRRHRPQPPHRLHRAGLAWAHAFFVGVGAYTAAYFGGSAGLAACPPIWPSRRCSGFVVGGVIGPFALRLRGNYLVVVTLGLVFLGEHLWNNWDSVTGGGNGISLGAAPIRSAPSTSSRPGAGRRRPTRSSRASSGWSGSSSRWLRSWPRTWCAAGRAAPCRRSATATCPPR